MARKKKRLSKKKKQQRQQLIKNTIISAFLCILVLVLSYLIFETNILQPRVNEVTASYISFNNKDTTDIIKISNIKKMPDEYGKSISNPKSKTFTVTGEKNSKYDVIIYSLTNNIPDKYINYSIKIGKETYTNTLNKMSTSKDGGTIIYQGEIKEDNKMTVHMWISKDYKGNSNNTSFEIKIKPR